MKAYESIRRGQIATAMNHDTINDKQNKKEDRDYNVEILGKVCFEILKYIHDNF